MQQQALLEIKKYTFQIILAAISNLTALTALAKQMPQMLEQCLLLACCHQQAQLLQ
jgi:hypothetical protein